MPRFLFCLRRARGETEIEELDLGDADIARSEALQACGDFLRETGQVVPASISWEMEVTSESGSRIMLIRFSAESFPSEQKPD